MAKDNEKKKNKKFRIKWWWDSEDEERAKEDSAYAEGLEKTEDAIKSKEMTKDEIQEKKGQILEETLENAGHHDDQEMAENPPDYQDEKVHSQNPEGVNAVQNEDGTGKFDTSGPTNTGKSHANRNDSPSAGNTGHDGNTTSVRNQRVNEENQNKEMGYGQKRSEDGSENPNADKDQKSSFFNWFGGGNNNEHGDISNKESAPTQGSRIKDEQQSEEGEKVPERKRPSHISWFGRGNGQEDGRKYTDERGNNSSTHPPGNDNARMSTEDTRNPEIKRDSNISKEDDTGGIKQNRVNDNKSKESTSLFGFGGKSTPSDNDKEPLGSRDNSKTMPTDVDSARNQDSNGNQRPGTNPASKDGTSTKTPADNGGRQDSNGNQRPGTNPASKDGTSTKTSADNGGRQDSNGNMRQDTDLRDDKNAQESTDYKSTILLCGYINLCLVVLFLFYTEILRDCTVMFNMVPLICFLLVANLPFLLFIFSRGRASCIISIIFVIVTVMIAVYLYMHRVRVYFYQISIDNTTSDKLLQIQDQPWSERTPSVLSVLYDNEIYLEDWIRSSKKPGAKIFILKHVLEFNDSQYQYLTSMAEKSLREQVKSLPPYENGAIITFPMIKYSWSKEKALEILKEVAAMKFSKIGKNYALIIGIYPNIFNYSEIFGTEPVNIGRVDARSAIGEFNPMKENPKV